MASNGEGGIPAAASDDSTVDRRIQIRFLTTDIDSKDAGGVLVVI